MNNDQDWISVTDKLPDVGREVIVFCPECRRKVTALVRLIRYEEAIDYYWDNVYGGSNVHLQNTVTHWMPLPAPPINQQ